MHGLNEAIIKGKDLGGRKVLLRLQATLRVKDCLHLVFILHNIQSVEEVLLAIKDLITLIFERDLDYGLFLIEKSRA